MIKTTPRQGFMARNILFLALFIMTLSGLSLSSCGHDETSQLPREIQQFISKYFAGQGVSSYDESAGSYTVNLGNSATLVFNSSLVWIAVDGNGGTLPQQFLYDEFPAILYDYIITTDNLANVYSVTRDNKVYTVTFHNNIISYSIANGEIKPVVTGSGE